MHAFATSTSIRVISSITQRSSCGHRSRAISRSRPAPCAQLDLGTSSNTNGFPDGAVPLQASPHDQLLGELMFCEPDALKTLVAEKHNDIDSEFYEYVDLKVEKSIDLEERESLRLLKEAVKQLQGEIAVKVAPELKNETNRIEPPATDAHNTLIDSFLEARNREGGLKSSVMLQYESIDFRMLELLEERIIAADTDSKTKALKDVLECITEEMNVRITAAASRLEDLFNTPGGIDAMKSKLGSLADSGGLDEAFILLLKNNQENAKKGGNERAALGISQLVDEVAQILERKLEPELKLLRKLLRTNSRDARISMLMEALKRGKAVALGGGAMSSGVKVDGKKFVIALRKLIEQYGSIDKEFVKLLSDIGEESEAVARKIYDMEGKDLGEMQKEAFHKRRVSVWDLENVEVAEEAQGRKAGWEGQLGGMPPGFSEDGKMTI